MDNKVLIKLLFPELDKTFDIFIPVNEIMWKIKKIFIKSISDLCNIQFFQEDYCVINKSTGKVYENNDVIINTDIRNGTELIFVSIK